MEYDGTFYASIGDFIGEAYDGFAFTRGTSRQVDFLVDTLHLEPGARILDVGCGTGRHSLELARRGYRTLGVDISPGLIEVAQRHAREEALPADFQVADARHLLFDAEFDAAICLCEGAFGLAGSEEGHRQVLSGVAGALRPGAPFILTAINLLSAVRRLAPAGTGGQTTDQAVGAARRRVEHRTTEFDPYTGTSRQLITVSNPAGEEREVEIFTTAFTYRELSWLLRDAGFDVLGGYRAYTREPLDIDVTEIMMVTRRREVQP